MAITSTMFYRNECWALKGQQEQKNGGGRNENVKMDEWIYKKG